MLSVSIIKFSLISLVIPFITLTSHPARAQQKGPPTPLGAAMQNMGSSFKTLMDNIEKPEEKASNLAAIAVLKENTQISLAQIPPGAAELSGEARDEYIQRYEDRIRELLKTISELDAAITKEDHVTAKTLLQRIAAQRRVGHLEFK